MNLNYAEKFKILMQAGLFIIFCMFLITSITSAFIGLIPLLIVSMIGIFLTLAILIYTLYNE